MTDFDERRQAEEARFARDEEMNFRVTARRNRLLGTWAGERMGLNPAEIDAYAKSVIQAEFEESGDEDVIRKVLGDLLTAGLDSSDADVRGALEACEVEARRALMGGV